MSMRGKVLRTKGKMNKFTAHSQEREEIHGFMEA